MEASMNSVFVNQAGQLICQEFLAAPVSRRFLFGATPYAEMLAGQIPIAGILDDRIAASVFAERPVVRLKDCPRDALIVSTILGRIRIASDILRQHELNFCDIFTFCRCCDLPLPAMRFLSGFREDAEMHAAEWDWIEERLSDEESLNTFHALRQFRLSDNPACLHNFIERQHLQYFENFLELSPAGECFADLGAFDGATTAEFIRNCPEFESAWIFEPDPVGFAAVSSRFGNSPRVKCFPYGASDKEGEEKFTSSGSTSAFGEHGDITVTTRALDQFEMPNLSFLKMDIEGAEPRAISGAEETIRRWHPRMAICVYHNPGDIWKIPQQVFRIRSDYKLFLRHYTEGVVETVMFFMPIK